MKARLKNLFGLTAAFALFGRILWERRVPLWIKALLFLAAVYVRLPRDIVPDIVAIIGRLDDLIVAAALLYLFMRLGAAALAVIDESVAARGGKDGPVIEGSSRDVEPE